MYSKILSSDGSCYLYLGFSSLADASPTMQWIKGLMGSGDGKERSPVPFQGLYWLAVQFSPSDFTC